MKIPADVQPRTYEVTYLIPAGFTDSERSKVDDEIATMVQKKHQGKIVSTDDWGKKHLAYAIKHNNVPQQQAYYTHVIVEMNPDQAQSLERNLQLHDSLIRHLVVKTESPQEETATE